MNFKRIGRLLACLVLICALLINVSPIKARAVEPVSTVMVAAKIVIPAVVMGLGVYMGTNPDVFDGLCNAIRDLWETAGHIVNDMCTLYRLGNGFAIKDLLVDLTRQHMWQNGYVSEKNCYSLSEIPAVSSLSEALSVANHCYAAYRFTCTWANNAPGVVIFWDSLGVDNAILQSNGSLYAKAGGSFYYFYEGCTGWKISNGPESFPQAVQIQTSPLISTDKDLLLGIVGASSLALNLAYPNWIPQQVQDEDEDEILYPLGFGQTLEETLGLTQEQIWAGETTYKEDQEQIQNQTLLQQLGLWFGQVLETLTSIPLQILDGLGQILINVLTKLFVPAQDFLQLKIQALVQKFGYLEPIISLGDMFKVYLTGVNPTPPVIWIDLGASAWYPLGGRVKFIDLSWYAQYKPTVDGILGAFLWLWFLWRALQAAPGIIQGSTGIFGNPDPHPDSSFNAPNLPTGQRLLQSGSFYHSRGSGDKHKFNE